MQIVSTNHMGIRNTLFDLYHLGVGAAAVSYTHLFLANAFEFAPVDFSEYVVALCFAVSIIPIVELVKLIQRKLTARR